MNFLVYYLVSILVLFLSYKVSLKKAIGLSVSIGLFILIKDVKLFPYEACIFAFFINAVPFIADLFKKDVERRKEAMRSKFDGVKHSYEELAQEDRRQLESNLEKEKKMQQVLSLYEISKDMSSCLAFEDILNIFSSALKKSFRFRLSRLMLLKDSGDIDAVYQIELGSRVAKVAPDDFDRELVKIQLEKKKTFSIFSPENHDFLRRLSIIKNFDTLICIPLFAEEKVMGVLYIENVPRVYFDNFIILVGQFAIQFQKVLLYKKVQEMSITDSLTEISTRRYFIERFTEEVRRSMRQKTNLSFLMLDLDNFKENNDKYGHLVGDVILREVSRILKASLREIDMIGRYGGEEFAIVLSGTARKGAHQVAERIRESIEGAVFKAYDEVVSTTISAGISVFPEDGADVESLIEHADKALYKAKESGRNRVF